MPGLAEQYEAGFSRKREARFFLRQAVAVGHEPIEAARNEPQWHDVAKHMLHAWDDGMASLRSPEKSLQFKGLKPATEAAGFSAPEPAERAREAIGHSPLLGKRS